MRILYLIAWFRWLVAESSAYQLPYIERSNRQCSLMDNCGDCTRNLNCSWVENDYSLFYPNSNLTKRQKRQTKFNHCTDKLTTQCESNNMKEFLYLISATIGLLIIAMFYIVLRASILIYTSTSIRLPEYNHKPIVVI